MEPTTKRRCLFFDRDGIVNKRIMCGYVTAPDEFEFREGFFDLLGAVKRGGHCAIVVTNQQGIAKGRMAERELHDVHIYMQEELVKTTGFCFDAIYYAAERAGAEPYRRKPAPAMLLEAAKDYGISLSHSVFLGDTISDLQAAKAADMTAWYAGDIHDGEALTLADSSFRSMDEVREAWHIFSTEAIVADEEEKVT